MTVGRSLAERIRVRKLVDERVKAIIKQLQVWLTTVYKISLEGRLHAVTIQ